MWDPLKLPCPAQKMGLAKLSLGNPRVLITIREIRLTQPRLTAGTNAPGFKRLIGDWEIPNRRESRYGTEVTPAPDCTV